MSRRRSESTPLARAIGPLTPSASADALLSTPTPMVRGRYVADVISCIASIDIVLGEVDR